MINSKFTIVTFYQFKKIEDISTIKNELSYLCKFSFLKLFFFAPVAQLDRAPHYG